MAPTFRAHDRKVSPGHAAWLTGTCTNQESRDVLIASLANTDSELADIGATLRGRRGPGAGAFLKARGSALYAAFGSVPTEYRADLLVAPDQRQGNRSKNVRKPRTRIQPRPPTKPPTQPADSQWSEGRQPHHQSLTERSRDIG